MQRPDGPDLDIRPTKYESERTVHLAPGMIDLLARHVADVGDVP